MKLLDLITPDKNAKLYHPTLGSVVWKSQIKGSPFKVLQYKSGKSIITDDLVLFSDKWEKRK